MKKIGFVIPWFAENISGGAESALREITQNLKNKNMDVEIITTCVKQFSSDWNVNYYKEGIETIQGINVRRFKVRERCCEEFDKINFKFMNNISVDLDGEDTFLQEMINSIDLYCYIRNHKEEYSLFVFTPYMFGTTYFGINECIDKAVLIPCLHDENYAHMQRFHSLFSKVKGMIFLSKPECKLANNIYDLNNVKTEIIGTGISTDINYHPERFREKYGIWDEFILYAGRKDSGKNLDTLIHYFTEYKRQSQSNLKLVLIGGGEIKISQYLLVDIIDLGYVSKEDKYNAYAAALFLCQPSKYESFSIVIMESWLCKKPVLVFEECEVTTNFVKESNGGLYFSNYEEFYASVTYFLNHEKSCKIMGESGYKFAVDNFSWETVTQKYINFFENLIAKEDIKKEKKKKKEDNIFEQLNEQNYIACCFDKFNKVEVNKAYKIFAAYKEMYGGELKLIFIDIPEWAIEKKNDIIALGYVTRDEKKEIISNAKGIWINYTGQCSFINILKILKFGSMLIVNGNESDLMSLCNQSKAGLYYTTFSEFVGIINFIENPNNTDILERQKKNGQYFGCYLENNVLKNKIEKTYLYSDFFDTKLIEDKVILKMEDRRRKIYNQLKKNGDLLFGEIIDDLEKTQQVQLICYGEIKKNNHQDDIMLIYHFYHTFINSNSELIFCGLYDDKSSFFRLLKEQINEIGVKQVLFVQQQQTFSKSGKRIIISLSDSSEWYYNIATEEREHVVVILKNIKQWMQLKQEIVLYRKDIEFVAELIGELTLL